MEERTQAVLRLKGVTWNHASLFAADKPLNVANQDHVIVARGGNA
jgi:hypothetical protein